jgi:putative hydrolase of the HAD superfamily
MKKKIVFDFAGVLFHWQPLDLLQRTLPARAVDEASAVHWAAQIFQAYGGDWADFDRGTVAVPALVARISQRTGLSSAEVHKVVEAVPLGMHALPDSVALVQRLHAAGHPLFFLSNMPAPYAAHLEANNPFLSLFSRGVFSARVGANKPEPAIFEIAAKQFDATPDELVFMDDHLPNVEAALTMGWHAFHFTSAAQADAVLRQRGWA